MVAGWGVNTTWWLVGWVVNTTWWLVGWVVTITWWLVGWVVTTTWWLVGWVVTTTWWVGSWVTLMVGRWVSRRVTHLICGKGSISSFLTQPNRSAEANHILSVCLFKDMFLDWKARGQSFFKEKVCGLSSTVKLLSSL